MIKIWEIDFTVQSGTSPIYYIDNIGNQHITNLSGTTVLPTYISPLPTFSTRPGVYFPSPNNTYTAFNLSNITSALMCNYYSQRTLEIWFYLPNEVGIGNSHWENNGNIWYEDSTFQIYRSALTTKLAININDSTYEVEALHNIGWKHIVIVVDRSKAKCYGYYNGKKFFTHNKGAFYMPNTNCTSPRLGDSSIASEAKFYLGKVSTYNEALNDIQVSYLYQTFLRDGIGADSIYTSISGYLYDSNYYPVSGAILSVIDPITLNIVNTTTTSNSGFYNIDLPQVGNFILLANSGSEAKTCYSNISIETGGIVYRDE